MTDHPILAIDHGEARIGLAATDEFGIAAHPVETIHRANTDPLGRLAEIIAQREVKTLLLGLPLKSDGREGEAAKKIRAFGDELRETFPQLPLYFHDESFTTLAAASKLRSAGKNAKKQKDIIDQAAALEILQNYLGW
ncbi:Holliday junction resolvase RuvX [Roseibacillus ishigakijimensis]|uniref:Putative pre-16S rRNA nuclease n=1 Tax=Roseibacillus ishigakijimensis TaxID=454146 RepID=A0A934RQT3_9BACT|nr:Holliday junction resolvase RuvX [Roseibacillus ishigakijimensis]MBK1835208.1 Holliday junction resolvase RuvX [Roseibacillus ishigakijimensis]